MYLNEFAAAAERTKSLGLSCPNIDVSDERFLSEEDESITFRPQRCCLKWFN